LREIKGEEKGFLNPGFNNVILKGFNPGKFMLFKSKVRDPYFNAGNKARNLSGLKIGFINLTLLIGKLRSFNFGVTRFQDGKGGINQNFRTKAFRKLWL